jgi:O-antigen ligase
MVMPSAVEAMNLPYIGELLRLRAFTASPTMLACVLTVSLPFTVAAWIEGTETRRWRISVAIGLIAAALVLTFSHAWAGAALALTIMSWPLLERHRPLRMASVAAVVLLAIALNLSLVASIRGLSAGDTAVSDHTSYHYGVGTGTKTIGPVTVDYTVMSYFRTKQLAIEAFVDHPLTGIGLDRFHDVTEAAYREGRLTYGYREIDPHSSLLGRLAETGFIGGLTLVVLWVAVIATAQPLIRRDAADPWLARAALAGFAGLLLAGINVDIMNFRFLWAGVGVLRGLADGNA